MNGSAITNSKRNTARLIQRRAAEMRSAAGLDESAPLSAGAGAEPVLAVLLAPLPCADFPLFFWVVFRANRLSRQLGSSNDNLKVSQEFRRRETPNAAAKSIGHAS
jgi:hypothetical protein